MRHHGRQVPTGTASANGQARWVDRQRVRVLRYPPDRSRAVVNARRELVLGRQPVLDRHHDASRFIGKRAADDVVGVAVADAEPAAMHEDEGGCSMFGSSDAAVEPQWNVSGGASCCKFLPLGYLGRIWGEDLARGSIDRTSLLRRADLNGRSPSGLDEVENAFRIRIERHRRSSWLGAYEDDLGAIPRNLEVRD